MKSQDENHVRTIAQNGKPASDFDWVTYINYSDFHGDFELGEFIRNEISKSHAVILRGYPYQAVKFSADNFWRTFKIPGEQKFVVSGTSFIFMFIFYFLIEKTIDTVKRLEDSRNPHVNMNFKEFCAGISDTSRVQCILDCPSVDGAKPDFIK